LNIPKKGSIIPNVGTKKAPKQTEFHPSAGVADALFTKVQQRVLGVIFGNPGRSYYSNEIIAMAGCGTGAVQRELGRLSGAGLVTVSRVGNQKHYRADPASPVYEELRALVLKTSGLADVLRAALEPLAPRIGAAFVYGSVAKGQDAASSDIDLMVMSDDLTYAEVFASLEEATARLGRPVNPTVYTRDEIARRLKGSNVFVKRVMEQPKLWLIGGEDGFAP